MKQSILVALVVGHSVFLTVCQQKPNDETLLSWNAYVEDAKSGNAAYFQELSGDMKEHGFSYEWESADYYPTTKTGDRSPGRSSELDQPPSCLPELVPDNMTLISPRSPHPNDRVKVVGVTLAILGCWLGIALVNPFFKGGAPADIRALSHTYKDELHLLRWLWLGLATFCIVACFQYPERTMRILQTVIRVAGLVIGVGIFVVLSMAVPETRSHTMLLGAAWTILGMTFWLTEQPSRPCVSILNWRRWLL